MDDVLRKWSYDRILLQEIQTNWYHYLASFFAGLFIVNAFPHFVHGVSGDAFPSPFARPPGRRLSSPTVNVLWGLCNFLVGYILLRFGKVTNERKWNLIVFFGDAALMSIFASFSMVGKMAK